MTAYTEIFRALTDGQPLPAEAATRLLDELLRDTAHELADQQRDWCETAYADADGDSHAMHRIKRRKKSAVREAADLIDPAGHRKAPPTRPARQGRPVPKPPTTNLRRTLPGQRDGGHERSTDR